MPVLPNARHERFAQELAKGTPQTEAYVLAGYKGNKSAASRLAEDVNLCERVAALKQRAAEKVEWGIADAVRELEEARVAAAGADTVQASAMVNATMSKAKLLGMIVDRQAGADGGPIETVTRIELVPVQPVPKDG